MITLSSKKWGVDRRVVADVIQCESSGNPNAIGALGEVGLVQFYLEYHPSVSREQALDAEFSIDFLAKQISLGNGSWWSCYETLHPS